MQPIILSRNDHFIRSFRAYSASLIDWNALPGIVLVDAGSIFSPENNDRARYVQTIREYASDSAYSVLFLIGANEGYLKGVYRDFAELLALPSVGSVDILRFDTIPQEYAKLRMRT